MVISRMAAHHLQGMESRITQNHGRMLLRVLSGTFGMQETIGIAHGNPLQMVVTLPLLKSII